MKLEDMDPKDRQLVTSMDRGRMVYRCLRCGQEYGIDKLLYTCPECGGVFLIKDLDFDQLKERSGKDWRRAFELRRLLNDPWCQGPFRFRELFARAIPKDCMVWLGEGRTPLVSASPSLRALFRGQRIRFKNEGQNPSLSFKDRGMVAAITYLRYLHVVYGVEHILSVCASTGDTSAAAALYAAYLADFVKSAVLLPKGKVTPQQLGQPLGAGASVIELPGVFDDCMKVVEYLAGKYNVALLNSKNAWRILGQETVSLEIAEDLDWDMSGVVIFVPIGNAGNVTAVLSGFIKLYRLGIIDSLPRIIGVQSHHSDPVFQYYQIDDPSQREWKPVVVQASVAQAAMIGDPVSMPRVIEMVDLYEKLSGQRNFFVVQVIEQAIIDSMILANRNGHPICTQGGETLAGLIRAQELGLITPEELAVIINTAHGVKFADFIDRYNRDDLGEFGITAKPELTNRPLGVDLGDIPQPASNSPLSVEDMIAYVATAATKIAEQLGLEPRT